MANRKTIKPEDAKDAMEFYRSGFHPLNREHNLDEVSRYVLKYCQNWMTDDEQTAMLYMAFLHSAYTSTNKKSYQYFFESGEEGPEERCN
jgi:hypothetical protein